MASSDLKLSLTAEQLEDNFSTNLLAWFTDLESIASYRRQERDKIRRVVLRFGVFAPIESSPGHYRHLSKDSKIEEEVHYWERYLNFLEEDPPVMDSPESDESWVSEFLKDAEFLGYVVPSIWIDREPQKMPVKAGVYFMLGSLLRLLCARMGQSDIQAKSSMVSMARGEWGDEGAQSILTAIERDESQYRCSNHLKTDIRFGSIRQIQREYQEEEDKGFKREFSRLNPDTFSPDCNTAGVFQTVGVLLKLCGFFSSDTPIPNLDDLTAHALNGNLTRLSKAIDREPLIWAPEQRQRRRFVLKLAVAHHNRELNLELLAMPRPT